MFCTCVNFWSNVFLSHSGPLLYGCPRIPAGFLHWWGWRTALQAPQQHCGGLLLRTVCPLHILHHSGTSVCRESLLTWLTRLHFLLFLYICIQHWKDWWIYLFLFLDHCRVSLSGRAGAACGGRQVTALNEPPTHPGMTLNIWGFGTSPKGTSAVPWGCPGTFHY